MTVTPVAASTVVTLGEAMGLFAADDVGTLDIARRATVSVGGAELNVSVGLARLGTTVAWIGRVGDDAVGRLIQSRLRAEGIASYALVDQAFTGLMVRYRRTGRDVAVDYHRAGSSGSRLTPDDLPRSVISEASILHVTGITPALSESAADTVFAAVDVARRAGVTISFDVNYRKKLWPRPVAEPVLRKLAALADVVFAGVDEAELLTGATGATRAELASRVQALGPKKVVIKDGPRGQSALHGSELVESPAVPVAEIDTVGAGDAFVAGYLAELADGASAAECLTSARAMGAFAVTVPGDCELLPTTQELAAFLTSTDIDR